MYHKLIDKPRHRFIDELYVKPEHRKSNVAKSLIYHICFGPLHLVVSTSNADALRLYTSLGFCIVDDCLYNGSRSEFCMKTTSYRRTKLKLCKNVRHTYEVQDFEWKEMSEKMRLDMIKCLARHLKVSERTAKVRLRTTDSNIRYAIV